MAQQLYRETNGKAFVNLELWAIVAEAPKWIESQRRSSTLNRCRRRSSEEADLEGIGTPSDRPAGRKAAKKRKIDPSETADMLRTVMDRQAAREAKQDQYIADQIMTMPTAGMDATSLRYLHKRRLQILEAEGFYLPTPSQKRSNGMRFKMTYLE